MSEIVPVSTPTATNTSPQQPLPPMQMHLQQQSFTSSAARSMPVRDDCWSEEATATLIEAWGRRYLDLNRGNLRQKQWQEVADTVNGRHGHIKKARRTDVQCKNRIDTLKKKYKIEKGRVLDSNGSYKSPWPFFDTLDHLIGNTMPIKKVLGSGGGSGGGSGSVAVSPSFSPPFGVPIQRSANNVVSLSNIDNKISNNNVMSMSMSIGMSTPVVPQKRRAVSGSPPVVQGEEYFRKNYAEMAAAAAREEESQEEEEEEEEEGEEREGEDEEGEEREGDGIRKLAKVIEKFGEVYARVEREKQKQLIELEKQRMQFAKEMECQRMQMLVEMQVQLEKIKCVKRSNSDEMYNS